MGTTQETGQHLVLFVAAGDGSEAACDAVARKLSEKFGKPYERMLASVRQTPRVFKRNMSLEQAESCAAMLRSMGAVAEVQSNGSSGTADQPAPAATPPVAEPTPPAAPETKTPPPEALDHSCPFCGRALQAGVCVICKPKEMGQAGTAPAPVPEPVTEAAPALEPEPPSTDANFPDPLQAGEGLTSLTVGSGPEKQVEVGCANCGGLLNEAGQCPTCDLSAGAPPDASAAIENDLSALLSPEELGVCPNCCGPMEQDGTCLICPPPDPSGQSPEAAAPATATPHEIPLEVPEVEVPEVEVPEVEVPEVEIPTVEPPEVEMPADFPQADTTVEPTLETREPAPAMEEAPARGEETSPFEPLAPLSAEPERDGADVCSGCGGPMGTDGACLICGVDTGGGEAEPPAPLEIPQAEEMAFTGNEPPPAEPVLPDVESAPTDAMEIPPLGLDIPDGEAASAAEGKKKERPAAKKKSRGFDLRSLPRGLTVSLLIAVLLLAGGIVLAMSGKFIVAAGIYFLSLIAGLVAVIGTIKYLQQNVDSFPKLPKAVIFAFICFLFFAGSGSIIGYALKQSAIFLLDKAGEEFEAEAARLARQDGVITVPDAASGEKPLSIEKDGQIILEDEILERAITAEADGEKNPRAALETWRAYLEGFPDGSRASEARRRISHWTAVVKQDDAVNAVLTRDRKGNNDPSTRIRDWQSCLATYGSDPKVSEKARERIDFWESMLDYSSTRKFPYWASLRMDDGREFSGKVIAENDYELKMELPNRLKMKFRKSEFELIGADHSTGKRMEGENMGLTSGVTTEKSTWGREDNISILNDERSGVQTMVSFPATGFYHFEVMARASKDQGGFPSILLSLNGEQQERIRLDSEEWKLYKVAFPFRIPAGENRLEILFPPHYQTMKDKRTVAIDYFTTAMIE